MPATAIVQRRGRRPSLAASYVVAAIGSSIIVMAAIRGSIALTALGFVAALDDIARFEGPHQVAADLGLVPSERSSGEQQHRGRITKRGDSRTRWLLVEAAWRIRRSKDPALAPLNAGADRIAVRRGKRVAIVALARRLAGILFAMWRDAVRCGPHPFRPPVTRRCLTSNDRSSTYSPWR